AQFVEQVGFIRHDLANRLSKIRILRNRNCGKVKSQTVHICRKAAKRPDDVCKRRGWDSKPKYRWIGGSIGYQKDNRPKRSHCQVAGCDSGTLAYLTISLFIFLFT